MRFHHLLLSFALLSGGNVLAQSAGTSVVAPAETLASLRTEVTQREAAIVDYGHRRERLLASAQRTNREIDALKAQAQEPSRDRKLQALLAEAQTRASELEQLDVATKTTHDALVRARQALVRRCDRELAAPNLVDAERVELIRLRAVQVSSLVQPAKAVGALGAPTANPLDGPRELEEKADLLRDSSDKLRKEARRIAVRIDDLERRRHLRERSNAVDEDWFSESTSNRRFARTTATTTKTSDAATPAFASTPPGNVTGGRGNDAANGGGGAPPGMTPGGLESDPHVETATVLRNLVDPATLEELRKADRGDDVDRQIRALRRAQGELSDLATDLDKKGKSLSKKAQEIRNQK